MVNFEQLFIILKVSSGKKIFFPTPSSKSIRGGGGGFECNVDHFVFIFFQLTLT